MRVLGATSVACVGDVVRWSERVSRTAHVLRHGRSSWKTRRACSDRFSAGGARTNVGYRSDNGSDNARTIFLPAQEKAGTKFQVQHCRAARKGALSLELNNNGRTALPRTNPMAACRSAASPGTLTGQRRARKRSTVHKTRQDKTTDEREMMTDECEMTTDECEMTRAFCLPYLFTW